MVKEIWCSLAYIRSYPSSYLILFWVRIEKGMVEVDWSSVMVISRLLGHDDWMVIKHHFEASFVIKIRLWIIKACLRWKVGRFLVVLENRRNLVFFMRKLRYVSREQ